MTTNTESFIEVLYNAHTENSSVIYHYQKGGQKKSMMPSTPFIHEFFIFNSLYSVDWKKSTDSKKIEYHASGISEQSKQNTFVKYICSQSCDDMEKYTKCFEPVLYFCQKNQDYKKIIPNRISEKEGEKFFSHLDSITSYLKNPSNKKINKTIREQIRKCTNYINKVRNNIFHGSKSPSQIWDTDQKLRIELYFLFTAAINALFFSTKGKNPSAAGKTTPSISIYNPYKTNRYSILDQSDIIDATNFRILKESDYILACKALDFFSPQSSEHEIDERSTLFYPSAGNDFLLPTLIALPYCRNFYFYYKENHNMPKIKKYISILSSILGSGRPNPFRGDTPSVLNYTLGTRNSINITFTKGNNMKFLDEDCELSFYFHRGDSEGEGGSGQHWDSSLLGRLLNKSNKGLRYFTDGQPGGLDTSILNPNKKITIKNPKCTRTPFEAGTVIPT
jgi:hypothetical protein